MPGKKLAAKIGGISLTQGVSKLVVDASYGRHALIFTWDQVSAVYLSSNNPSSVATGFPLMLNSGILELRREWHGDAVDKPFYAFPQTNPGTLGVIEVYEEA